MRNSRKNFDKELYEAFRRAAELEQAYDLPLEDYNELYPHPCDFKEFVSRCKTETTHTEEFTSSIAPKRNGFSRSLKLAAAVLVIAVLMPVFLTSGRYVKSTSEHGYTVNEYIDGYEYFKVLSFPFHSYEEYYSFQEIGPIHRKYVPTYIPEVCPYTDYDYNPNFCYEASYTLYDIDAETGENINDVKIFIFASKTHTAGTGKKTAHHPEIIELPSGDHGVIVKDKKTDMIRELYWANDEISIRIISYKLPFEELVKILEGIKYTTEFTE